MTRNDEHKKAVGITVLITAFLAYVLVTTNPSYNILNANPYTIGVMFFLFSAYFLTEYFKGGWSLIGLTAILIPIGIVTSIIASGLDPNIFGSTTNSPDDLPVYGIIAGVAVGYILRMSKPAIILEGTFSVPSRVIRIRRKNPSQN